MPIQLLDSRRKLFTPSSQDVSFVICAFRAGILEEGSPAKLVFDLLMAGF